MKPSLWRKVWEPRNTELGIGKWAWPRLDPSHWWMDSWHTEAWRYLHCPLIDLPDTPRGDRADERVTRVYPRDKKGYSVRMGMKGGELYWIYDRLDEA